MSKEVALPIEEQHALHLLMTRGRSFVLAFFSGADVSEDDLARVYYGLPVAEKTLAKIQKVLRGSLTND